MHMLDMTHKEIKEHLEKNRVLIIPVGTCEQHGYHLPLGTDTLCAEAMVKRLSQQTGAIVAPTVNYGITLPSDRTLTGTTTSSPELLHGLLLSILDWWRHQGFNRFVIVTYHGDPFHIEALTNLGEDTRLVRLWEVDYSGILERQDSVMHACEAETSVMLYLHPEKVKMHMAIDTGDRSPDHDEFLYHQKTIQPEESLEETVGSEGFPTAATAEKGKLLVERMMDKLMIEYMEFVSS